MLVKFLTALGLTLVLAIWVEFRRIDRVLAQRYRY